MTDGITVAVNYDVPEGYPVEGHGPGNPGREPPGSIGIEEHGEPTLDPISPPDLGMITSAVWGNIAVPINTPHAHFADWDPCYRWDHLRDTSCCPCCWYRYAADVCVEGCRHPGMDIGVQKHTALFAADGGAVVFAGWSDSYRPYHVRIKTAAGEQHIYAHMWSVDPGVVTGGQVHEGQYLGTSGEQTIKHTMTPDLSGPHLHFERLLPNGCSVDPTSTLGMATTSRPCVADAPPPFDGAEHRIGQVVFHPAKRTVTAASDGVNVRRYADKQACKTRDPLMAGEKVKVLYWINGYVEEGEGRWWVAEDGSRIWTGGTVEKP